eukprot:12202070-Ditylum_brightwellii.AAC.1
MTGITGNIRDSNEDQIQSNYTQFTGLINLNSFGTEPIEQEGLIEDQMQLGKNDSQEEEILGQTKETILTRSPPGGNGGESDNGVTKER